MNAISQVFKHTQMFRRRENDQEPSEVVIAQDTSIAEAVNRAKNQEKPESISDGLGKEPPPSMPNVWAYLEDRPIYLFDEWASDQEPLFRVLFYKQILFKLKERGKTVLVITHDDRYFHLADQIIKLNYGKVEPDPVPISSYLKPSRPNIVH